LLRAFDSIYIQPEPFGPGFTDQALIREGEPKLACSKPPIHSILSLFEILNFGHWSLFGIWCLRFVIYAITYYKKYFKDNPSFVN